ncbi:hypothetical protein B0H14DRAFT_3583633 [Mycena olivaceomarginata]|nr:hypothetical protein B0H14DRAFT_3583633 [Mycena olivaceomarginata]
MSGPRRTPDRSPPPVYQARRAPSPQYEPAVVPVDLSSGPVLPRLRPLTLIEPREADFILPGYNPLSFDPNSLSFDPTFSPLPSLHLSPRNSPSDSDVFPASLFPGALAPHRQMTFPVNDTDFPPHLARETTLAKALGNTSQAYTSPPNVDFEDEDLKEFEIVLHVFPQVKKPAGRSGKSRAAKPEPVKFGPISANGGVDYDGLMGKFAKAMGTEVPFLNASSVEWRWMKPANSQFVPLRDTDGLKSMLKHINSPPKGASGDSIIVKMDAPVKRPATQHMSWSAPDAGPSSAFPSVDDYESGDDGPKKKVPFDEGLEEEMEKLAERYPPGVCSEHPTISCFHDRLTDLHFELDRNRKIVWAAAILCVTSAAAKESRKFTQGSNVLESLHRQKSHQEDWRPGSSLRFHAYCYCNFCAACNPSYPVSIPLLEKWVRVPASNARNETPRRRRHRSWDGSSPPEQASSKRRHIDPPSSPALLGGSVDEFIAAYPNLPPGLKPLLQKLGFEIGDDITVITEAQWTSPDIAQFTAARIVKYYHKYKAGLRSN